MSLNFSNFVRLTIPEGAVKKITRKIDGVVLWSKGYVNQVPISKNENGGIYNGIGYKDGYRVRSGGAEAAVTYGSCTGFIPAKPGDIIRISGADFKTVYGSSQAINIFDASFTNLGQMANNSGYGYGTLANTTYGSNKSIVEESEGVFAWTVPPAEYGITAYVRVTAAVNGFDPADGSKLIVTVNEEIE